MKMVSSIRLAQWLLVAIIGACSLLTFVSCSNDDDEMYIDYYLSVQSRVPIYNRGGVPLHGWQNNIGNVIKMMRQGIQDVYPVKNMQGNDNQVIHVCDQAYHQYSIGHFNQTVCTLQLYKVLRSGTLIKETQCLKCYTI